MPERSGDWMWQAKRDLNHARTSRSAGDHEWACFAAQQAAEKGLKALYQARNMEGWGHVLIKLAEALREHLDEIPDDILDACRRLDRFYIPTRYPNGFAAGAPGQFYDQRDAEEAIGHAVLILAFCEGHIR